MTLRRGGRRPDKLPARVLGADAVTAPAVPAYDGRKIGTGVHLIIATLLAAGVRRPSPEDIFDAVGRHPLLRQAVTHRLAARQRLTLAVGRYFHRYVPPSDWELLGAEVSLSAPGGKIVRFDLVWRSPDRLVVVDELKTDRRHLQTVAFKQKLELYRTSALAEYGAEFSRIRVLLLRGAPGRRGASFELLADGSRGAVKELGRVG